MSDSAPNQLTVVIPSWNQRELLRNCLNSLKHQTASCRVLVVDNGSTDATVEMLKTEFPEVGSLRLDRNLGFSRAVNEGIKQCRTEYVGVLNNDTEADRRWVEVGLRAFLEYPQYFFFASRMIRYFDRDRLDSAGDCYGRTGLPEKRGLGGTTARFPENEPVLGASAGAAFYRRALFDEIGLFDEDYFLYLEDVELSLRAQLAGRPCLYLADATVYHIEAASDPHRSSGGEVALADLAAGANSTTFYSRRRVYWITRNRWQLMMTYQPFRHLPWLIYGWCRNGLFHALKVGFSGAFLKGILAGLAMTPKALRKRMQMRRLRRISVAQLCRLMAAC